MPFWYFDKKDLKNTPSFRDGIDFEVERRYRKEGARFIMSIGTTMGLGHNTIATGIVYFHRFYMIHSFRTCPRYVTACCCLFLAGKVEETPKKCKDIIKMAKNILSEQKFQSFGDDPKEEVMTLERILLQTIKFDLQVEHPYNLLVKYAKCLKGDIGKVQKVLQMAWNFVNDSLSTTLCLQWEPEIIAVALIYLACKLSKFNAVDWHGRTKEQLKWWDMFVRDITMDVLEDICHQVLDLYQKMDTQESPTDSPPQNPPSRAATPPAKRLKTQSGTPIPSPVTAPPAQASSAAMIKSATPIKLVPPSSIGNSIPVKVSSNNDRSDPVEPPPPPSAPPHKIPKMPPNNVHPQYSSYPSTSYGHSSNYGSMQQPPLPPIPPPNHQQAPPPPHQQPMSNSHSHLQHNSGYSRVPIPQGGPPPVINYNAPPPPVSYHPNHPPIHNSGHHPGPNSNYYPPQSNYSHYPNSHHNMRKNRNNYHYHQKS